MSRILEITIVIIMILASSHSAASQILPPNFRPVGNERTEQLRSSIKDHDARITAIDAELVQLRQGLASLTDIKELERLAAEFDAEASRLDSQAAEQLRSAQGASEEARQLATVAMTLEQALTSRRSEHSSLLQRYERDCAVQANVDITADCANLGGQMARLAVDIVGDSTAAARARDSEQRKKTEADSLTTAAANTRQSAQDRRSRAQTIRTAPSLESGRDQVRTQIDIRQRARDELTRLRTIANDSLSQRVRVNDRWVLPVRSRSDATVFYGSGGQGFLQNVTLSNSLEGVEARTLATELYSDYAGAFRFAGHLIIASTEETQGTPQEAPGDPAALQRFFAGGGTLVISGGIPLVYVPLGSMGGIVFQHLTKAGMDLFEPGQQRFLDETVGNLDMGFETYGSIMPSKNFGVFAFTRWGGVAGTRMFYEGLGYGGRQPFGYFQWNLGLRLGPALQVVFSNTDGPYNLNRRTTVQFQVSPPGGT